MPIVTVVYLAKRIDHSLLNPVMTDADLDKGIALALRLNTASVCIKPYAVALAARVLKGSSVAVGTVVGFPHGGHSTEVKVEEARRALGEGAVELDLVVNIGKVLSGDWAFVEDDLGAVLAEIKKGKGLSKVIFENCFLKDEHKIKLCGLCTSLGADYVKTSTGYGNGGATDADLKLMRAHTPPSVKVKAAGGVRTFARLIEVIRLGCDRVGATATEAILTEAVSVLGEGLDLDKIQISSTGPTGGY